MCGIVGAVWTSAAKAVRQEVLHRMTTVLSHRGPDDQGTYYRPLAAEEPTRSGVALGHRRLSIIDLAGGHQPMSNEDGSVWVVFNGEIYNFRDLRRQLEAAGHRFRTRCDTEVLVHLYEQVGEQLAEHLNGMFALAIWDQRNDRLLLARDRLGQKPLYYRHEPGRLLFASELKGIMQVPDVPRQIDPVALDLYLVYQYVPHPWSIFTGTRKLPPGHYAVWQADQLAVHRYWQPELNLEEPRPAEQYRQELFDLLRSAVELRLQSDVPLGAFLSGGVDSSIIVALMQQLSDEPVRTFSIGFAEPKYDETRYARLVAQHLGTRHYEFCVGPDAIEILPKLVWYYDEPFADSSAIPTWYVAEQTRQHVTVALTGDGGDELFVGYPRYRAVELAALVDRLPVPIRWLLTGPVRAMVPRSVQYKSPVRRLRRFLDQLSKPSWERYLRWIGIFEPEHRQAVYTEQFARTVASFDPLDFLTEAQQRSAARDLVTSTSLTDLVTYLPCDLMTKVDIASMAHGLECRQPLLDHRVVELAAKMPLHYKYRRGRGKRLLLETFGHLLPQEILHRPKMGFGVPLDSWFRGPLAAFAKSLLLDRRATSRGIFRPGGVSQLLDEHISGRADHSYRLWALVVLEMWQRKWVDGRD